MIMIKSRFSIRLTWDLMEMYDMLRPVATAQAPTAAPAGTPAFPASPDPTATAAPVAGKQQLNLLLYNHDN